MKDPYLINDRLSSDGADIILQAKPRINNLKIDTKETERRGIGIWKTTLLSLVESIHGNQWDMQPHLLYHNTCILIDFSLTVKATTLIFISGRGSTILSA